MLLPPFLSRRSRTPLRPAAGSWARFAIVLGFAVSAAAAQTPHAYVSDAGQAAAAESPWIPDVINAIDEYVPDPGFLNGRLGLDHFAASNSADIVGGVTAPLANGDIVVAGLVPNVGAGGTCSNGTALCSIGLVRYSQAGVRRAWSNPGAIGFFSDNYVIYGGNYQYIRDVKVSNGKIYVMVDVNVGNPGSKNVQIVGFNDNGSLISFITVFGAGGSQDFDAFYGAQMVIIAGTRMMATATGYDATGPFVAVNRLDVSSIGTVTQDANWGQPYGGEIFNRVIRYFGPGGYCGQARCDVVANSAARQDGFAVPTDFYVATSIRISGENWDPVAIKISSDTGALKSEFNGIGWSRVPFNEPNSTNRDIAAGIYVFQDGVYMGAQVARKCHDGIGLAKLNGATGDYIPAFGPGGTIVFGGQGNAPFCISPPFGDVPFAISATGGRIGIVGYGRRGVLGFSNLIDPMLAVVNAVNGTVLDYGTHPVRNAAGARLGDAVLFSVYGGPSPTSPFTVAGNGRIESAGNTSSYLVGKLIPVSADRIFANGFD